LIGIWLPDLVTKKSNLALCHQLSTGLLTVWWLLSSGPVICHGATFGNTAPINFPAGAPVVPYPSSNMVSGVTGLLTRVSVTLVGLNHPSPDDIDILLVGPGGHTILLMSDAGGSDPASGVNLTFSDDSGLTLPDATRLITGTYRPSNYGSGDTFPSAPAGPYGGNFSGFTGTNPNGAWRLFVYRDTGSGIGSIAGGWRLNIESANPPVIVTHPQSQTVPPGATVTFSAGVTGTPPFGFQWLRNGQVSVPFGLGAASLTISNVQMANAGTYAVVVTNSANRVGVISSNALLNVLGPLTIVESPRSQIAAPGDTVILRITAAGTTPLQYQWKLNGVALPDETNSSLTISNAQAPSGGAFSVVVFNDADVITTDPAILVVRAATGSAPTDDFRNRPTLETRQGVLQGNSATAGSEPGEPVSPGGGKTVWFEWLAPDQGIMTVTARGSAFDTILNVFTSSVPGTISVSNLALVATDDDQAGFYTSRLQFNAQRGARYQIMLDGFDYKGIGGDFTLDWLFEVTDEVIPVILAYPQPLAIQQGSDAFLRVLADSADATYQWFFNDVAIRGATSNVLSLVRPLSDDIGFYSVLVQNSSRRFVQSPPIGVQIGSGIDQFAVEKPQQAGLRPSQGAISIGLGETGYNEFPSQAYGGAGDPTPCSKPFFKTLFQSLHAEDNGVIQVDSMDSEVPLLLAVYRGVPTGLTNLDVLVACDVLSGPAGQPAIAKFTAAQGSNYTAVISALQGNGTETIKITGTMGVAPNIPNIAKHCLIVEGGSLLLQMPATNWFPVPACQWLRDGIAVLNATNTSLIVTQAGTYSVIMSNFVAANTNLVAHVEVAGPFLLGRSLKTNNATINFVVAASNAAPFILQTTTNLGSEWSSLVTNPNPCVLLLFTNNLADPRRFFRAIPWPPPGP
jgi:hypothetical protein